MAHNYTSGGFTPTIMRKDFMPRLQRIMRQYASAYTFSKTVSLEPASISPYWDEDKISQTTVVFYLPIEYNPDKFIESAAKEFGVSLDKNDYSCLKIYLRDREKNPRQAYEIRVDLEKFVAPIMKDKKRSMALN